jgi:hypothetical protein
MNPKSIMSVGFIVGMNREQEYWKNKIIGKMIEIKDSKADDQFITKTQGKLDTIIALEELLKRR